jgi:transcription termination factor Rho
VSDPFLGILELTDRGTAFLRRRESGYAPADGDLFVPPQLVKQYGLRTGDAIAGEGGRGGKGRGPSLQRVATVNDLPPDQIAGRPEFSKLSAVHPKAMLQLEVPVGKSRTSHEITRLIDLLCPFGKGQRALIVAPAKAGKTTVLQAVAEGVALNHPQAQLFILLVDERPEEVTEMEMAGAGEVVASSFDCPPERHAEVAELTLERARRQVELGRDSVIILDSITRLARAYNMLERSTGRTLSGGLDAGAMEKPKKFLGSARCVDPSRGGGSLTIIGTALVDTGSKMDQVIFEEFKGTGNSELVLSRELAERRIYPAIDIPASSTRREELLFSPEALAASHALRQRVAGMTSINAMQEVLSLFRNAKTNAELIPTLTR